jgi:hypothetical protein
MTVVAAEQNGAATSGLWAGSKEVCACGAGASERQHKQNPPCRAPATNESVKK